MEAPKTGNSRDLQRNSVSGKLVYSIDTELPAGSLVYLPEFLEKYYTTRPKKDFSIHDVRRIAIDDTHGISFRVQLPERYHYLDVEVLASIPINVSMRMSTTSIARSIADAIYDDLMLSVQIFEEEMRKTILYLAFMPREELTQESEEEEGWIEKIFTDSMINFYIILIAFSFFFLFFFGIYAPIILVGLQFLILIFAGKILGRRGKWMITEERSEVTLLQYQLSQEEYRNFREKHAKKLTEIKRKIYERTLYRDQEISCDTAHEIFQEYGVECRPGNFSIKRINLFKIVKKAAQKFNLPIPRIVVSNAMIPNAAATGISPSVGTVLVTTGAMVQLEEDELFNVVGHEMSHLKARDPIILFFVSSAEFLLRFYLIWPLIYSFFFLYFFLAMFLIYFFGKFLEARADLDSAVVLGQPKVMAESLRKIGFRRLIYTMGGPRAKSYRLREWLRFDPHPPLYFRVERLEELEEPIEIKHTFIRSVGDCLKGFFAAI